jgi:hypothetical protein
MSHDSLIGSTISTKSKKSVSCASLISSTSVLSHDTKTSKVSEKANLHDYVGDEEFHQEPDHPSTFINMVKERTRTMSVVNDERRQVLPSKVIWDGTIDRFEVFRNNVEVYCHYGPIGAGYLFDSSFQEAYLERVVECYVDFLDDVHSIPQIKKDARALYGALLSACQSGVGRRILMENRDK